MSKFTIKIMGIVFESDGKGLLDLNDIWRGCILPNTNRPSQWRGKVVDKLKHCANLHTARKSTDYNEYSTLVGDERATVAYAMWVSFEFYCEVLDAFIALRKGNLEEAVVIAGNTMSENDNYYLRKLATMKGLCWTKTCWYANIPNPQKLMEYLKLNPKWKYTAVNSYGKYYATEDGIESGYFYNCYGTPDTNKVVMRVTKNGREMLREHSEKFNSFVQKLH